uniref:SWIM-type domain-containing protein n=1 Tax=Ciona intestinalis TaxID=7719 RepID=F6TS15_CIOIN
MENWDANVEVAEEGFSFEDSDRFDDESICSWMSETESFCTNWRGWRRQNCSLVVSNGNLSNNGTVTSLMELCAQAVAIHIPFEQVEEVYKLVPENVQLRIAFWSFPDNEEDIRLYSCLANGSPDEFLRGEQLVRGKCVRNVLQIGFHLCANVVPPVNAVNKNPCSVAVMFDRRRITSCSCNCGSSAKWCAHVVALCLIRIQQPLSVCMRAPVSESLSRLRRDQLQKFAQYLISELPQQILPTAQRLLDELLSSQSTVINRLSGAPDPTAGPSMSDKSLWFLDEHALNDNIKKALVKFCGPTPIVYSDVNSLYLSSTEPPAAAEYSSLLRPLRPSGREPEGIWNLLSIVREMLKRRDSNAIPLLDIVTDQCLAFEQVAVWWYNTRTSSSYLQSGSGSHSSSHRPSNNISSEIAQHAAASMCDEIVALWRLVILDPGCKSSARKNELKARLLHFHDKTLEIIKRGKYKESHLLLFEGFKPAIAFCDFDWDTISINLCSHIVHKKCQSKVVEPPNTINAPEEGLLTNDNLGEDSRPILTRLTPWISATRICGPGTPGKAFCKSLSHQPTINKTVKCNKPHSSLQKQDNGSGSDDSCIERDFESLHISPVTLEESPLDFTSDDGSSACSPVQFTMSSEDDYENSTINNIPGIILSLIFSFSWLKSNMKLSIKKQNEATPTNNEVLTIHIFFFILTASTSSKVSTQIEPPSEEDNEMMKYRQELDAIFTRAESLYTHGRSREACELAVKLAEEILAQPDELIKEPQSLQNNKKAWIKLSTSYACKSLERALFLCNVLLEHQRHHTLAFRVGLQGLELKRLPASSKALEVKLFYQQGELANLMKRLPLGQREVLKLCEKANVLANIEATHDFQHVLPLMLTTFIFDAFCQTVTSQSGRTASNSSRREITSNEQEVGFAAAVAALGFKINVSEAEHPLLCEGTRKQKGELALQMLLLYKDQRHKLRLIIDSLLDKTLSSNLRASSAFPSCSSATTRRTQTHTGASDGNLHNDFNNSPDQPGNSGYNVHRESPHSSSCEDDYPSSSTVCSPPRRDSKLSWRSPTVRPKRKQHCLANVNSSASEEAMLSDTSPRLRRRNLSNGWLTQRYPSSPSSDSGSSSSVESVGTSSNENKRGSSSANNSKSLFNYRKNRGKNSTSVPDLPNQPSEAAAHFFFELAKNVLVKAGGNSSTSLFMQQPQGNNQSGVHRNLVLAAFEIGLYALGLHNCVSPNWLSRTYSSHVSWITGQAMEIGSAALHILVDSWEGHLTPPETASLADRASRGRDSTTVRRAAELALSVLPHAHALNPNEIQRALLQCREQGAPMLEKACHAVEQAGRGGGVYPEVLFDVARQWEWIHRTVSTGSRCSQVMVMLYTGLVNEESGNAGNEVARPATAPVSVNTTISSSSNINQTATVKPYVVFRSLYTNVNHVFHNSDPFGLIIFPSSLPVVTMAPRTVAHTVSVSVSGVVLPGGGVITIQDPRIPPICHPAPIFHGFAPTIMDPQINGVSTGMPPLPHYAAVHLHPAPAINLVPMPTSNLHALQYHPSRGPFLPDPHHHHQLHHQSNPQLPPIPGINLQSSPISTQHSLDKLQSAFRVGMLALDLLTKRTEDRPNNKYARNPPYASDVKWILKLSIKLGMQYVQQFCVTAVGGVSSPFVLQDIALETAKYLSEKHIHVTLRVPFLHPILSKCLQMYVHFIHNRLYHIHHTSDYDDFVALVHTARGAFCMSPGGLLQFNEVLQSIRRSKACKNELWQKINTDVTQFSL